MILHWNTIKKIIDIIILYWYKTIITHELDFIIIKITLNYCIVIQKFDINNNKVIINFYTEIKFKVFITLHELKLSIFNSNLRFEILNLDCYQFYYNYNSWFG